MSKDLADFSVDYVLKKGAGYADARFECSEGSSFVLNNGIPEASAFGISQGIGLRFILKDTLGFVAINHLNKKKMMESIDKSIRITKAASRLKDPIKLSDEKLKKANYEVKQKINFLDIGPGEKLKALKEVNSNLKKADFKYLSLSDGVSSKYFINSEGIKINSKIPQIHFFYFLVIGKGDKSIQRVWQRGDSGGWEFFNKWNLNEELKKEVDVIDLNLRKGKKVPSGNLDVIIGPEITGIMVHESIGHPSEADRVAGREAAQAGESFMDKNLINKRVGSNEVTIIDDPTIENSYGYYLYDDEGVKARKRTIVDKGILKGFLHNRETAYEFGVKSNGSARASSFEVEPLIRMGNTFVKPGDYSDEELVEGIKKGVYLKSFTEWNIDDVRFNQKYTGLEAYYIENGEIKHPIKKPALEITTTTLWKSVDAIGENFELFAAECGKGEPMQGMPVLHGGPSLRLRGVILK